MKRKQFRPPHIFAQQLRTQGLPEEKIRMAKKTRARRLQVREKFFKHLRNLSRIEAEFLFQVQHFKDRAIRDILETVLRKQPTTPRVQEQLRKFAFHLINAEQRVKEFQHGVHNLSHEQIFEILNESKVPVNSRVHVQFLRGLVHLSLESSDNVSRLRKQFFGDRETVGMFFPNQRIPLSMEIIERSYGKAILDHEARHNIQDLKRQADIQVFPTTWQNFANRLRSELAAFVAEGNPPVNLDYHMREYSKPIRKSLHEAVASNVRRAKEGALIKRGETVKTGKELLTESKIDKKRFSAWFKDLKTRIIPLNIQAVRDALKILPSDEVASLIESIEFQTLYRRLPEVVALYKKGFHSQ
ncbi:MAG: hypothetical protein Q7S92_04215 [Candidatus Diapherotrites archaeon]|nr:hypothetical protein [Candidatus Diapherotrites archaeon]